ncbi:MAG: tRNA uracil 4-sulfurtransferase ThiI [Candidatus Micrarchaeota archaeon]
MLFLLLGVTYSEIMMKGGNRRIFESRLISNMLSALSPFGSFRARKLSGRILLSCEGVADRDGAMAVLARTFGIEYAYAPVETSPDMPEIEKAAMAYAPSLAGKAIKVDTRRSDKSFPLNSQRVNEIVGARLVAAGCSVDLDTPEETLFIEIMHDRALLYGRKVRGPGGLPLGSSGKALSLLSGGIDSPVASWLLMKRGCNVDFLHLHQSPEPKAVLDSKMPRILKALGAYCPGKMTLIAAPYTEFYKRTLSMDARIELVLFRRFLFHLSNALAESHGYKAVVSGDSLGQVASQTIDNIFASDEASRIPVFRPLIGFNKQEITDLAMKIGTYGVSIEPYKDCCSLVATKRPSTKVPLEIARKAEEAAGISEVVSKTLAQAETFEL